MSGQDCLPQEGLHAGAGENVKNPPSEEGGTTETVCGGQTTEPQSLFPFPCTAEDGEGREKIMSVAESRKMEGLRRRCFLRFGFVLHYLDLI